MDHPHYRFPGSPAINRALHDRGQFLMAVAKGICLSADKTIRASEPWRIYEKLEDKNAAVYRFRRRQRVREFLAVNGYRRQRLTQKHVGEFLFLSRIQTEDFLAGYLDLYDYDPHGLTRETEYLTERS
jgi:hypothetical protein